MFGKIENKFIQDNQILVNEWIIQLDTSSASWSLLPAAQQFYVDHHNVLDITDIIKNKAIFHNALFISSLINFILEVGSNRDSLSLSTFRTMETTSNTLLPVLIITLAHDNWDNHIIHNLIGEDNTLLINDFTDILNSNRDFLDEQPVNNHLDIFTDGSFDMLPEVTQWSSGAFWV